MRALARRVWRWRAATRLSLPLPIAPRAPVLWAGSKDGSISAWDTQEGALLRRWRGSADAILTVAESPDGSLLASGGEDSTIRLWDSKSGKLCARTRRSYWLRNGSSLHSGWQDAGERGHGNRHAADLGGGDGCRKQVLKGPSEGLLDVAVQPQGPWLVGAGRDGAVWVWNADALAFEPAQFSRHGTEVNAVNFSADGLMLASAGSDGAVYLWSTVNPSAEPDSLVGRGSSVNGVSFAPDGTWLAVGECGWHDPALVAQHG